MANDPFYKYCCLTNVDTGDDCDGKIEWHHNLIFGGRQLNEPWAILPLCKHHHDNIVRVKELVTWIMLNRASDQQLKEVSKAIPYINMRERLNKLYGTS